MILRIQINSFTEFKSFPRNAIIATLVLEPKRSLHNSKLTKHTISLHKIENWDTKPRVAPFDTKTPHGKGPTTPISNFGAEIPIARNKFTI